MKKLFIVLLCFSLFSCTDDEDILTEGEINAQKLHEVLNSREFELIRITWTEGGVSRVTAYEEPNWAIEGSFLRMEGNLSEDYFNLDKLKRIAEYQTSRVDLDFE